MNVTDIMEEIDKLPVVELNQLWQGLEKRWGVTAASFASVAVAGPAVAAVEEEKEEKTSFTVSLKEVGDSKLNVIKVIREVTGLGIKEAKGLADAAPKPIKDNVPRAEAEEIVKKISEAGGKAEIV
jgi:large subunit ribosomal protein L7/L12